MKTKLTTVSLLTVGTMFVSPVLSPVYAETNQDKLSNIQSQLQEGQEDLDTKTAEKQQIEKEAADLQKKIDELTTSINKNEAALNETKAEIEKTQKQIAEKKQSIEELQKQIDTRNELIKQRLQSMQEHPRTNLITEVLTGTESIAELFENMYSVSLILESDKDIIEKQKEAQDNIKKEKEAVETKEQQLKESEATLQKQQKELETNQQEQQALVADLHTKLSSIDSEIESLEESQQILENQRKAVQQAMEEDRKAEEARKADEAKRAKEAAQQNKTNKGQTTQQSSPAPSVSTGGFIRPAAGTVTSGFNEPGRGHHPGMDIAASGTVPIVASADGVVIRSDYSSSYGNVVYLSHHINGQTFTTVYAHMSSRSVSVGQTVSQGQQLGFMGNTGDSTGQHLHFEIHAGEWNQGKTNAVNPALYIN